MYFLRKYMQFFLCTHIYKKNHDFYIEIFFMVDLNKK